MPTLRWDWLSRAKRASANFSQSASEACGGLERVSPSQVAPRVARGLRENGRHLLRARTVFNRDPDINACYAGNALPNKQVRI